MARWDLRRRRQERLAAEVGTLRRVASRRLALCYPSPYSVAMASLGYQTIYRELNGRDGWAAERAFLPDAEEEVEHGRTGAPLVAYESETPVGDFPALAFSVSYELELAGLTRFLDLAGVPPRRAERDERHSLVVCGGPLTYANARPLGAFADVVVLGEAEEALDPLLAALTLLPDRAAALAALSGRPGFWLPGAGGTGAGADAAGPGALLRADDCHLPAYSQITTPESDFADMFLVEAERGCSRRCAYCVMRRELRGGMRLVPPATVLARVPAGARRVGLVGAAVTDHPELAAILRALVDGGREVGVSSVRAERLDAEVVDLLRRGGQRTLTVAGDGASQRLRDQLDRGTREEDLLEAGRLARAAGMRRLKLYQLVGVPGETDADLDELVRFTRELSLVVPVALAVAPLVPKRNTPLADAPFGPVALLETRLHRLRAGLRDVAEVRAASARTAWIEHALAQGDEAAGEAAIAAARAGGGFAAWRRALVAAGATKP